MRGKPITKFYIVTRIYRPLKCKNKVFGILFIIPQHYIIIDLNIKIIYIIKIYFGTKSQHFNGVVGIMQYADKQI